LDQVLVDLFPEFSRSRIQQWIDAGYVTVDGHARRRKDRVHGGEEIRLQLQLEPRTESIGEDIPLRVVFEDEHILVVNKPADFVVHPAAGNPRGTLQNALLHHCRVLAKLPRAGIVHRLDKDTTGLLVVAKTLEAHKSLVDQLQRRTVSREYRALVNGAIVAGGRVDAPIGRHPRHRTRMAVVDHGKPAVTHYSVLERFSDHTLLDLRLETGRTHQIRVHMAYIHHPLVGDRTYGGRPRPPKDADPKLVEALQAFPRQALHARALGLDHPRTGERMRWEISLPPDMSELLDLLRTHEARRLD
jgi:23S rRNA pseudouridine1911/1915/1917 synthase